MVVDGNGKRFLRLLLPNHVLVEDLANLLRFRHILEFHFDIFTELFLDDLVAKFDAFIADVDAGACHELSYLLLRLAAEGALELALFIPKLQHDTTSYFLGFSILTGRVMTSSMRPYSFASSAVMKLSRSVSAISFSRGCPVCLARMSLPTSLRRRISFA